MYPTEAEILDRVAARLAHQRYAEQKFDRCGIDAIGTLAVAHNHLDDGMSASEIADMLRSSQAVWPVSVADVWPQGVPAHWQAVAS